MKKILLIIIMLIATTSVRSQLTYLDSLQIAKLKGAGNRLVSVNSEGVVVAGQKVNVIDVDTMKIDGVPLLLNTFKQGNLGGASNIFYSTGASSQPASGSVTDVVGDNYIKNQNTSAQNANILINGTIQNGLSVSTIGAAPYFSLKTSQTSGSEYRLWNSYVSDGDLVLRNEKTNNYLFRFPANSNAATFFANFTAPTFQSTIPTGTPPLVVASSTKVDSLNVGLLDGKHESDFLKYTDPVIESDTIKARTDIITPKLKTGTTINNTTFEADGTMVMNGDATVFEDLNFSPLSASGVPATLPDYVTINNTTHREFTSANNQLCGDVKELPHAYKLSTTLQPHAHLFLKSGESVGTTGVTFVLYWELRQTTGTTSGSSTLTATSAQLANGNKVDIYTSAFTGAAELGAQLSCTIARTAGDAGDIVLLSCGVHYEVDMIGSRTISSK